ncbi:MAG TPA: LuxR C-terminal-related transcriptional regulator [Thermomicrobiales bacterium]|nr:LuxR C-terminal-related transcriptional regulator [Thermomicrobiales bacterium]
MLGDLWRRPEVRVLTLTGVGGTGKTCLALHFAAAIAPHFPHRAWVVELAAVSDAELVPGIVMTALGLHEVSSAVDVSALATLLASQPGLIVLDNCEHLIDACASLADSLLDACPDLRIIATSREPLHVAGEQQYRVPPLETPDLKTLEAGDAAIAASPAVQLFVARAQAVQPAFQLTTENAGAVARICSRLGGIPLALELAAARAHVLGVEQILVRLDATFHFLTSNNRVAPTRHQTLKAALDWSDDLLSERERAVFRRLGVFSGEFQIEMAEEVCASTDTMPGDVLDAVMGLANKSLIVTLSEHQAAWHQLLEPVRQYALGHLSDHGELAATRARHVAAYIRLAEQAAPEIRGPEQDVWLRRLSREQGNLRVALEWAMTRMDAETALRLATALVPFWEAHGHIVEGRRWLHQALEQDPDGVDPLLRMRALRGAGRLAFQYAGGDADYAEAEALDCQSLELARAIGDQHGIAWALTELGMVYRLQRKLSQSAEVLSQALAIFRALDDAPGIAMTVLNLGTTVGYQEDATQAFDLLSESLNRFIELGDRRFAAIARVLLSQIVLARGDVDQAFKLSTDAVQEHARLGDRWFVAFDLLTLSQALLAQRRLKEAVTFFAAAHALSESLNSVGRVGEIAFRDLVTTINALQAEPWFDGTWAEGYALGLDQVVEAARTARLEPMAVQTPTAAKPLTRRELEVARLLADGLTDRQIADSLYLSTRTVGVHVHNILQKLDLRSRVEVAGWLDHNK